MFKLNGQCHCGAITVAVNLTVAPQTLTPRACDCDYCTRHAAAYVSDPRGRVRVRVHPESACGTYRQGSGQAEFVFCRECGVLIGVTHAGFGAINARVFDARVEFAEVQVVSPRTLSAAEKRTRWSATWFAEVMITPGVKSPSTTIVGR